MAETFDDVLRAQFRELHTRKADIMATARPHRTAYEAKRNQIMQIERDELNPLMTTLKEAEKELFAIDNEIAAIARALKGRTGEPAQKGRPE